VELHLIDQAEIESESPETTDEQPAHHTGLLDLPNIEREARVVGMRLRELLETKHPIWEAETRQFRPVEWRDMVVLMRSPSDRVEAFAKEFNLLGIPLTAVRSGFFQSTEISDLLSVLKLLDNPLQDVPLLAVLRSPLAGMSLNELAEVRAHNREKPFWLALNKFHKTGSTALIQEPRFTAWAKTEEFLSKFGRWRELARQSSLSHCLETVLGETHYEALLLAEARGQERVANIRRLLGLARDYDPYQRQGLYRFLRFVQAQQDADLELEPASAQTENAVRLMSIHKSKGLEFPVVVVAGLGVRFNRQDLRGDILLHESYGLCPKVKPPRANKSYPSLAYWLARREEERQLLGEEMRLLYVALTRARDTLILTGSSRKAPRPGNAAAEACLPSPGKEGSGAVLSTLQIISAGSHMDWLRLWLSQVTTPADWSSEREGQTDLLHWNIYKADDPRLLITAGERGERATVPIPVEELDELELVTLKRRVSWQYPFLAATMEPAVKRVSTSIWEQSETEGADEGQLLFKYPQPGAPANQTTWGRPATKMAAVDIGAAHHRLLEMAELRRMTSMEHLKRDAARLLKQGALMQEEIDTLDFKALVAFWVSDIGEQILAHEGNVHREIPFTARFSPDDFAALNLCPNASNLTGEYFVVRGKADLVVLLPKEIWLLDFKTDQLSPGPVDFEEKIKLYAPQLKLYALGLGRLYRRPVTRRWLHFLSLNKTVLV
jgi:ATP-dependent helicase/nuclease subunit A